jgi:hypothetical protein
MGKTGIESLPIALLFQVARHVYGNTCIFLPLTALPGAKIRRASKNSLC